MTIVKKDFFHLDSVNNSTSRQQVDSILTEFFPLILTEFFPYNIVLWGGTTRKGSAKGKVK